MQPSSFGKINFRDILHGAFLAALAAVGTGLIQSLDAGALPTVAQLKADGVIGLTTGLSYIVKQLMQNSAGQLLKKDQ